MSDKSEHVHVDGKIEATIHPDLVKKYDAGQDKQDSRENIKLRVAMATLLIVFTYTAIAFWQGCSNKQSADAAKRAADIGREALESVQRAFILPTPYEQKLIVAAGKTYSVLYYRLDNAGTTPAKLVRGHASDEFMPDELPDNFTFQDRWNPEQREHVTPPTVLGPKAFTLITPNPWLNPSDVDAWAHHKGGHLYSWGWITYHDIFPHTAVHVTEFCHEVLQVEQPQPLPPQKYAVTFETCKIHNCYDEDCPDYDARKNAD